MRNGSKSNSKILIAHTNVPVHPNWNSNWPRNVADEVLDYGPPFENESYIQWLEGIKEKENQKSLFDYAHLLMRCRDTGADYVLMIEDDTVLAKGWYGRTMEGLEAVVEKMRNMGYTSNRCKFPLVLYLEGCIEVGNHTVLYCEVGNLEAIDKRGGHYLCLWESN
jgi:hypothetical protein